MITRETIDVLRNAHGAGTAPGDDETAPYGYTLLGALNQMERVAQRMDDYGISYSSLPADTKEKFDKAHDAFQWHVRTLTNEYADNVTSSDGSIELPNGKEVGLPNAALNADTNKDIPGPP